MQNILDMSRTLTIVYVWSLLVFSFFESSILTIFYIFSFCLVLKTSIVIVQVYSTNSTVHFVPSNIFGQCWCWRLFNRSLIWKVNFSTCSFFRCFFLTCKFHISDLCIILYFRHGKCSIWGFLVLAFIKSAILTTIYFFSITQA